MGAGWISAPTVLLGGLVNPVMKHAVQTASPTASTVKGFSVLVVYYWVKKHTVCAARIKK